jgi:hypothetical protein
MVSWIRGGVRLKIFRRPAPTFLPGKKQDEDGHGAAGALSGGDQ